MQSEQINELAAALAKSQAAMKAAALNKINPHFKNKYADLASVIEAIRKPLADNALSYTQTTEIREGGFVLVTTLRHSSGQWVASEYPLPIAAKPQELGSALTYARRYSLSAIACIAADDDDDAVVAEKSGQIASAPKPNAVKPKPVDPPVHPGTGEVSPHAITAPDPMTWGAVLVAAVNTARDLSEVEQWLADNAGGLDTLKSAAPKVHDRVMARVAERRATLAKVAA